MSSDCFYCGHVPHDSECPTVTITLLMHDKSEWKEEAARLQAEVKLLNNKIDACVEEIDDLEAENAKLREALQQIANKETIEPDYFARNFLDSMRNS